jgi:hypothetical protein
MGNTGVGIVRPYTTVHLLLFLLSFAVAHPENYNRTIGIYPTLIIITLVCTRIHHIVCAQSIMSLIKLKVT